MEASEKAARNIIIRKFNELMGMRTLEEALAHLQERNVADAIDSLQKAYPNDSLINKRKRTFEMAKIIDELKNQLTLIEKSRLLDVLQLEDASLENQITVTKAAIIKRDQAKTLIDHTLIALNSKNNFDDLLNLIRDELFEAIDLLHQANFSHYGEQFAFFNLLKEVKAMRDTILEDSQPCLFEAIKTGSFNELNQALIKAKAAINQHRALNALFIKYTQAATLEEIYQSAQTDYVKNTKFFWKPAMKDPKKVPELLHLNDISQTLMQDNNLTLEQKANALYNLLLALKQPAQQAKSPVLATTLESVINELAKHPTISP